MCICTNVLRTYIHTYVVTLRVTFSSIFGRLKVPVSSLISSLIFAPAHFALTPARASTTPLLCVYLCTFTFLQAMYVCIIAVCCFRPCDGNAWPNYIGTSPNEEEIILVSLEHVRLLTLIILRPSKVQFELGYCCGHRRMSSLMDQFILLLCTVENSEIRIEQNLMISIQVRYQLNS